MKAFQIAQKQSNLLGASDVELMLPILSTLFDRRNSQTGFPRIVIDIGANVGRTSSLMLKYLSDYLCRRDSEPGHESCREVNKDAVILSFEPIPDTFNLLRKRALKNDWNLANWIGIEAAVGEESKKIQFFMGPSSENNEQASQDPEASYNSQSIQVDKISIDNVWSSQLSNFPKHIGDDALFKRLFVGNSRPGDIFLLKIDCEGYDYDVLDGAKNVLTRHEVKFISFEYNAKWFTMKRERTLHDVVQLLKEKYDYDCHWITPNLLIPVFGSWWSDEYEIRMWSNIFCGQSSDKDLQWLVQMYNSIPQ
jgi:hypothetical protein